jgi:hypothetical protein
MHCPTTLLADKLTQIYSGEYASLQDSPNGATSSALYLRGCQIRL